MRPRPVRQTIFTIIARPDPSRAAELEAHLNHLDALLVGQTAIPFSALAMLHFCSFTVFADSNFGPYLVFESNIDGRPKAYIDAICSVAAPALHQIYGFCLDYRSAALDPAYLRRYLRRRIVHAAAAFVGNVGRSAQRIRDEAELVARIEDVVDELKVAPGTPPDVIVAAVRDYVRGEAKWDWVWQPAPRLSVRDRAVRWIGLVGPLAAALVLLPFCLVPLAAYLIALRRLERTDPIDIPGPSKAQLATLTSREDKIGQNHMASLCYLKPGPFRRATLKFVLSAASAVARVSTGGTLSGLDSLHFAHWSLIDGDARLLFLTNYDGSWENYLDDFIDKAAIGLTAIWSNTLNFPRTSFLVLGGARDERRFKAIARTTQAYTNLWYSAYPDLTVNGIEKNTAICEGLAAPPRTLDARAWLRRL
jgi:hypothetical protein